MKKIAVITTKFVIENNSLIVSVFKDDDGDWQFFGKEDNISESDARIVGFDEILKLDPSIQNILWLEKGMQAWRNDINDKWNY